MLRVWLDQQPDADRAEQHDLGDRLAELDQALHAEDALHAGQRIELAALEGEAPWSGSRASRARPARAIAATMVSANRTEERQGDDAEQAQDRAGPDRNRATSAASKLSAVGHHRLQRVDHHRPGERDPGGADEHDQRGAELARLEDVALLRASRRRLGVGASVFWS